MRAILYGGVLILAGCGGEPTVSPEIAASTAPESAASPTPAPDPAHVKCEGLPNFVTVRPDVRITSCTSGPGATPGRTSGTVIFFTDDRAVDVTAWYRAQAKAAGMQDALNIDKPNPLYSAKDSTNRNIMVLTERSNGRTKVTLNWGSDR